MGDPACYRAICPECDAQVTIVDDECPDCGASLPDQSRGDEGTSSDQS